VRNFKDGKFRIDMQGGLKERASFKVKFKRSNNNNAIRKGTANKTKSVKSNRFVCKMFIRYCIHNQRSYSVVDNLVKILSDTRRDVCRLMGREIKKLTT
jgi:hypothetical protein